MAVAHNVQERSGPAISKVIKSLRPRRSASTAINGTSETFSPEIPAAERETLVQFGQLAAFGALRDD